MKTPYAGLAACGSSAPSILKAVAILFLGSGIALAQNRTTFEEINNTIKAPNAFAKLGATLFGDSVNLYTGELEFVQTDFTLKGNNALPMGVSRRLITGGYRPDKNQHFGSWELEIPHMHGVFGKNGWTGDGGAVGRCSRFGTPPMETGTAGGAFAASEFWQGNSLYIPGQGSQQMLIRSVDNTIAPSYPAGSVVSPAVTKNFWTFTCKASLANASNIYNGEGFIAWSPDGTKYVFDHMVTFSMPGITKPAGDSTSGAKTGTPPSPSKAQIAPDKAVDAPRDPLGPFVAAAATGSVMGRIEIWLLPTSITDRFGNQLIYSYDPSVPGRLLNITAKEASGSPTPDERKVTFSYGNGRNPLAVTSVSDGTRTWTYAYDLNGNLSSVTLPDNSKWQFNLAPLQSFLNVVSSGLCDASSNMNATPVVGTITHPSGALGTFTTAGKNHGRSNVTRRCHVTSTGMEDYPKIPKYIYKRSLISKVISGPGMPDLTWKYDYYLPKGTWTTECTNGCEKTKVVTVTDPKGDQTRYTYGTEYHVSEGRLEMTETGWNNGTALQTTKTLYRAPIATVVPAVNYPSYAGDTGDEDMGDSYTNARYTPEYKKITTLQGVNFTWEASAFDRLARPTQVTKTGTGGSRTESTVYEDNYTKYVLGQVKSVTESSTGLVMQQSDYDPLTTSVLATYQFGLKQQTYTYNRDGTVATVADGLNQITTFSDYKRGIPRLVKYADDSTEKALVNDIGGISSYTNAANYTTGIGYDAMGRVNLITPPEGNPISLTFGPVSAAEQGIAAGHWRQTVSKGNSRSITYLDAFWRPVITTSFDQADRANTERSVLSRFDHNSNLSFQSYPQRSIASVSSTLDGVATNYDALGRVTSTVANSEIGNLTTTTVYLSAYGKQVTNPLNATTITYYQTFDTPSENAIATINAPEGVKVQISRDIFGKTKSITRSGSDNVSATRSYVYDIYQRLCKTIEPETGATIQSYDAANNVSWRAIGINSPSTSSCDQSNPAIAAAKTSFTYDKLNRLATTTYADGSPGIIRTYTPDGLPLTVATTDTVPSTSTAPSMWTSSYNPRRQLKDEILTFEGVTYSISRTYDANGALTSLSYPAPNGNITVDYAPNALGEASKIGSYASNLKYYPNGAIAGFTYGNGIVHSTAQNMRGLPRQSLDVGILNDTYIYDANANVQSITDVQENLNTRSMTYDKLDRLKTATGYFGNASYTYDSLDNIKTSTIGNRSNVHNYNPTSNLLTSITSNVSNFNYTIVYDGQGNITQRGNQNFTFDRGNRLSSAPGKANRYLYDGLGHRLKTNYADGSTQVSLYTQAGQLLFTQKNGGSNSGKTSYIYLDRHQIAEVKN